MTYATYINGLIRTEEITDLVSSISTGFLDPSSDMISVHVTNLGDDRYVVWECYAIYLDNGNRSTYNGVYTWVANAVGAEYNEEYGIHKYCTRDNIGKTIYDIAHAVVEITYTISTMKHMKEMMG